MIAGQLGGLARAQDGQSAEQRAAIAAFVEGDRLSAAGRWSEACARYTESQRLDPQLGALLHVADCNERLGKLATAWNAFREASVLAEQRRDPRLQLARERAAALAARVAQLHIRAAEPAAGLEIALDGTAVAVGTSGTQVGLDAGEHTLEARAFGKQPWTHTFRIADGAVESVQVPPLRAESDLGAHGAASTGDVDAARSGAPAAPGSTQRTLGWISVGTGAAAAIATGVLLALQDDKADAARDLQQEFDSMLCPGCPQNEELEREFNAEKKPLVDDQRELAALSIASGVAGGVLIAVGVALLLTAPDGDENAELSIVPAVGPRNQQLQIRGRF
jgi:hypothetical protein